MSIRTIIVDDEELARRGLEIRLQDAQDIEIVAQCANGRQALAAISEHAPDLMFLDIQMPGLSGLDVLASVPQESMPMVVFVTAFDRFAIDAFEARALDYLLKPFDRERFHQALARARQQLERRPNGDVERRRILVPPYDLGPASPRRERRGSADEARADDREPHGRRVRPFA